jgi:hypothetical protein
VPASAIDQAAQGGEQLRHTVYFVKHHEAVLVAAEESRRIGELGPIFAGFKVEVNGRGSGSNGVGQRGFSDLTEAGQGATGLRFISNRI